MSIDHTTGKERATGIDHDLYLPQRKTPEDVLTAIFGERFPRDVAMLILSFRFPQILLELSGKAVRCRLIDSRNLVEARTKRAEHISRVVRESKSNGVKFAQGRTWWSTPQEDQARDILMDEIQRKKDFEFLFRAHFPNKFRLIGSS